MIVKETIIKAVLEPVQFILDNFLNIIPAYALLLFTLPFPRLNSIMLQAFFLWVEDGRGKKLRFFHFIKMADWGKRTSPFFVWVYISYLISYILFLAPGLILSGPVMKLGRREGIRTERSFLFFIVRFAALLVMATGFFSLFSMVHIVFSKPGVIFGIIFMIFFFCYITISDLFVYFKDT